MRISGWSSDVCSSDLLSLALRPFGCAPGLGAIPLPPGPGDGPRPRRSIIMAAIGLVSGTMDKGFIGQLTTITIRVPIEIRRNLSKNGDVQPDYRVWSDGVECGAGWLRRSEASGKLYVRSEEHTSELQSLMRISYAVFCLKK